MAIQWYYSYVLPQGGSSNSRSIHVSGKNALITQPQLYDGVIYGTKDNPAYRVSMSSPLVGSTAWYYYVDINTNIGGGENTGIVGVIDGTPIIDDYTLSTDGNKPISGRWRTKPIWPQIAHGRRYLLPINNTVILADGNEYASNEAGSKSVIETYPYLTLGGMDIGVNTGISFETDGTRYENMIVDFGDVPQDAPALFTDYIEACFNRIYPNTYAVISPSGDVLALTKEQPPIIKTNLTYAGSAFSLALYTTTGTVITLQWEYQTPSNTKFIGMGYTPNDPSAVIPIGENDVEINDSANLYPIYVPYNEITQPFDIYLYQNTAEPNRVDKTNYLTDVLQLSGVLRDECSLIAPSIIFESSAYLQFNYVYIPAFGRYYFVLGIDSVNKNLWRMRLNCDVLMSYKEKIWLLDAVIDRQENDYNALLPDNTTPLQTDTFIVPYQFASDTAGTVGVFDVDKDGTDVDAHFVLTTIGGI